MNYFTVTALWLLFSHLTLVNSRGFVLDDGLGFANWNSGDDESSETSGDQEFEAVDLSTEFTIAVRLPTPVPIVETASTPIRSTLSTVEDDEESRASSITNSSSLLDVMTDSAALTSSDPMPTESLTSSSELKTTNPTTVQPLQPITSIFRESNLKTMVMPSKSNDQSNEQIMATLQSVQRQISMLYATLHEQGRLTDSINEAIQLQDERLTSVEIKLTSQPADDENQQASVEYDNLSRHMNELTSKVASLEASQGGFRKIVQNLITQEITHFVGESSNRAAPSAEEVVTSNRVRASAVLDPHDYDHSGLTAAVIEAEEERTNQISVQVDKWQQVQKDLHAAILSTSALHRHHSLSVSTLTNFTSQNGFMITQLIGNQSQQAKLLTSIANATRGLEGRERWIFDKIVMANESMRDVEENLLQILELIQLNSDKVETIEDALNVSSADFSNILVQLQNDTDILNRQLVSVNDSLSVHNRTIMDKLDMMKQRTDDLRFRSRILDDRLTRVEVKYLEESIEKYQKTAEQLQLSVKVLQLEDQMEVAKSNIQIQQTNHESLSRRITETNDDLEPIRESLRGLQVSWRDILEQLPTLETMNKQVVNIVNMMPNDCSKVPVLQGYTEQLIRVNNSLKTQKVLCYGDDEGKWTVIQHRFNGAVLFNRTWSEYRKGFGERAENEEFWLGNELLHTLTNLRNYSIRFDMVTINGTKYAAEYRNFRVDSELNQYTLYISDFSGNATNSMNHSDRQPFSAIDLDNDKSSTHCASFYTAGWWYKHCQYANLNGRYTVGLVWFNHNADAWMELKESTIRIRPQ